jgi:hypothetical protein
MPPEGQRVKSGRGYPAGSVGVAAVVGINGVLGEDIRVLYPLIVLWTVTLPAHHVPEAAVPDLCFEDLVDLPPLVSVHPEDRRGFVVPGASGEQVRLRKLEFHHREDRVELGVAWRELELVRTFSHNLYDLDTGCKPSFPQYFRTAEIFNFLIISATFPRRGNSAEIMYFRIISSPFPPYFRRCGNMIP